MGVLFSLKMIKFEPFLKMTDTTTLGLYVIMKEIIRQAFVFSCKTYVNGYFFAMKCHFHVLTVETESVIIKTTF